MSKDPIDEEVIRLAREYVASVEHMRNNTRLPEDKIGTFASARWQEAAYELNPERVAPEAQTGVISGGTGGQKVFDLFEVIYDVDVFIEVQTTPYTGKRKKEQVQSQVIALTLWAADNKDRRCRFYKIIAESQRIYCWEAGPATEAFEQWGEYLPQRAFTFDPFQCHRGVAVSERRRASEHPEAQSLPLLVAPATGNGRNTFRMPLQAEACWRVRAEAFAINATFPLPVARKDFVRFLEVRKRHPNSPISVFGHAQYIKGTAYSWKREWEEIKKKRKQRKKEAARLEKEARKKARERLEAARRGDVPASVGPTDLEEVLPKWIERPKDTFDDVDKSKELSDLRAAAIYAVLVRDLTLWKKVGNAEQFSWGKAAHRRMLLAVRDQGALGRAKIGELIQNFQQTNELLVTGLMNRETESALAKAYMDFLCPMTVKPSDFIGGGEDAGGRGAYQGCGQQNPVVIPSEFDMELLEDARYSYLRHDAFRNNDRVLLLLFPEGIEIPASKWNCPAAGSGDSACKTRFWSDSDRRRKPGESKRDFATSGDTFACRTYQRAVEESPCEGKAIHTDWIEIALYDSEGEPAVGVFYTIVLPDGRKVGGRLNKNGRARYDGIPSGECTVTFDGLPPGPWSAKAKQRQAAR